MKGFMFRSDGSLLRKTIRSGLWVSISVMSINILSFLRSIVLARLLLPEAFGLMSICLVVIRCIEVFSETGFGAALIHKQGDHEKAKDVAYTLMVVRSVVLAGVAILLAPLVAGFYEKAPLSIMIRVIAASFVLKGFYNISTVTLQKELNFKRLTLFEQTTSLVNSLLVIGLAYYMRNVWALVLGHILSTLLGTVMSFVVIPGRPRFCLDRKVVAELFGYGKYITGIAIVTFLAMEVDHMLVGKILGMEMLGYYVIAYTLANLPATHITKVVMQVIFPAFSILQNDLPRLREAYLNTLRALLLVAMPVAVSLFVLGPEIIRIVYGQRWSPAIIPLQVLSVFGCMRSTTVISGYLFNAIGKPRLSFHLNSLLLLLILVSIYPITKIFGLTGTAVVVTASMVIQYLIGVRILKRTIGLSFSSIAAVFLKPASYSLITFAIIYVLKTCIEIKHIAALFALIGLSISIYGALNLKEIMSLVRKRQFSFA